MGRRRCDIALLQIARRNWACDRRRRRRTGCLRRTRLAPEQAAQEAATARLTVGGLALELLHARLQAAQRLLLHQEGLRHVVGCGRQGRDLLPDVRLCVGITLRRLLVDLPQLVEQPIDHLPLTAIHDGCPL